MFSIFKDVVFGTGRLNECLRLCEALKNEEFEDALKAAKSFAIEANTAQRIKLHQPNTLQNRARITGCEGLMKIFSGHSMGHIVNSLWLHEASKCLSSIVVAHHGADERSFRHYRQGLHAIIDMFIRTDVKTFDILLNAASACTIVDATRIIRSARKGRQPKIDFVPSIAVLKCMCVRILKLIDDWKKEKHFELSTEILLQDIYPQCDSYMTVNLELLQLTYVGEVLCEEHQELRQLRSDALDRFEDNSDDVDDDEHLKGIVQNLRDEDDVMQQVVEQLQQEIK